MNRSFRKEALPAGEAQEGGLGEWAEHHRGPRVGQGPGHRGEDHGRKVGYPNIDGSDSFASNGGGVAALTEGAGLPCPREATAPASSA